MLEFFQKLFEARFMPHGYCFLWRPDILWMSVISDGLIALSYYVIPVGLFYVVRKRHDTSFSWLFYLFGLFILTCGTTHVLGIVTLWYPICRFEAFMKALTAIASLPTAIALIQVVPRLVAIPSPAELTEANEALRREIGERKKAEEQVRHLNAELERRVQERTAELQSTSERLKAITESSPLGICAWDLEGRVTFWNPAMTKLYGWTSEEVTGQLSPTLTAQTPEESEANVQRALSGKAVVDLEAEGRTKAGDPAHVSFSLAPLQSGEGEVTGVLAVVADTGERTRAEQASRESESRFRTLADCIPQLAWMTDEKGYIVWYNQRWYNYTGSTFEEMQGWGWRTVHHPDHVGRVMDRWRQALADGVGWEDTFPLLSKQGEWRWFLSRANPIHDEHGNLLRWFGTNTDITEQLRSEQDLRASKARFRQLADAMPQIVWVTRPDGEHEYLNRRWNEYTGVNFEQTGGEGWLQAVHPADGEATTDCWNYSLKTGEPLRIEYRMRAADGEYRWFLGLALPGYGDDGDVERWYGTCTDIHDQKRTEQELRRANTDLQQFAYAASHDLQEPLRNMALFSQLLDREYRGQFQGDSAQFLEYIVKGAQRMHELLRDVLAYSRVSGPETEPELGADSSDVFQECTLNLSAAIEESGATVTADPLPTVAMSRAHLLQLMQNLLSNGVKYRSEAPPVVSVKATRQNGEWLFAVRDNGIGIDPRYHQQIFGLFKRLHREEFPGTGIGLAICQKIVERYGGRLWLESEPGQGSTFYFTAPALDR